MHPVIPPPHFFFFLSSGLFLLLLFVFASFDKENCMGHILYSFIYITIVSSRVTVFYCSTLGLLG